MESEAIKVCPSCRNQYSENSTIEFCICGTRLELELKSEDGILEWFRDMFRSDSKA